MPEAATTPDLAIEQGRLRAEINLRPFTFTIRRAGRRLLRSAGAWVAEGVVQDHFIQFTEGVVAAEELAPHERAARANVTEASSPNGRQASGTLHATLTFEGGRTGTFTLLLHPDDRFTITLTAADQPLRLAFDWDRRSNEHFVGLGARHGTELDQRGRMVQLGADRRYTGPDCPPEMLEQGGIPQGDCAPMP